MINKTQRYKELKQATFMTLHYKNNSLRSQELCNTVTQVLLSTEIRKRARKKKDMYSFNHAVELIIAGLLFAKVTNRYGWAYRGLGNDTFQFEPLKVGTFKKVLCLLEEVGYIEISRGSNHSNPFYTQGTKASSYVPGLASRFRATDKLLDAANAHGITLLNLNKHYFRQLPTNVLKKKASSTQSYGQKTNGHLMKIERTTQILKLEDQVKKINLYLDRQELSGAIFSGYHRVFNMADSPDFYWNKGGRLNCPGIDSYQRIKKNDRLSSLKINGESIVEVDINASYLSIYHGLLKEPLPDREDIYSIPGLHRDVVKGWITAAFGNNKLPLRWPSATREKLLEKGISMKGLTMIKVGKIVCKHIPLMKKLPTSGITWGDLMYTESCAIIAAMESLRNNHDVPAYSMHDGLMVPHSAASITAKEIVKAFNDMGLACRVKLEYSIYFPI